MSTKRLNQTDFANKLGIKRQAVNNAIRKGQLIKHGQGRAAYIDMTCPMTVAYIANASTNRHRSKVTKPRSRPAPAPPEKKSQEPAPPSPEAEASLGAWTDKQLIEHRKLMEQIEKLELDNRKTRNELVARKLVQAFMDKLFTIHNGQLGTLGLRVATDLAAIFGIEDQELIRRACDKTDKDVFAVMKHIKRDMNKFLKQIGGEKIKDEQAA